jgi:two-component system cell cycle sensor histidine kinase/response regulator CckA
MQERLPGGGQSGDFESAPSPSNAEPNGSLAAESLRQNGKTEVAGRFAGGIVHDLNNILTVIVGCSQLLLEQPEVGQLAGQRVQQILDAGFRAAKLTSQLLAYSRKQSALPVPLHLGRVVMDSEAMIRSLIGDNIELQTEFAPDLWNISAESEQMKQLLFNLCLNARDAMSGGGTMRIACQNVTIPGSAAGAPGFALKPGPYVRLSVTDTGAGMDAQTLAQISEMFFDGKVRCCQTGLATVHYIVKHSGGCVWAQSQPQEGTCFSVYLPALGEPAVSQTPNYESLEQLRGEETLLLFGVPPALQSFLPQLLESLGYIVLEAEDADQARQMIERNKEISALLLDIGVPGTSGLTLAASLRRTHPGLKTLQLIAPASGFVNHPQPVEGSDFVRKPFVPAVLARKLRVLLAGEKRIG